MRDSLRRPALLAAALAVSLLPCAVAQAARVFAGTWASFGFAHLLCHEDGVGWSLVSPPPGGFGSEIWDLEVAGDELWVACSVPGRILAWDGATWRDETPSGGGRFRAVVYLDGAVHAVDDSGVFRRAGVRSWDRIATLDEPSQALVSTAQFGREMLFLGQDIYDEFWVHDPLGTLACGDSCPASTGQACPAGCFGGSCIYAMVEHERGMGTEIHAGAYLGSMYRWSSSARRFAPEAGPASGHVQGLASFAGSLWLGDSDGEIYVQEPGGSAWSSARSFGAGQPISELDTLGDRLWVGTGGVPFGSARRSGLASVWTFDGEDWLRLSGTVPFGDGVTAFALFEDDVQERCAAGDPQALPCLSSPVPVELDGSFSRVGGALPDEMLWSGPFLEGTASGAAPTVHFDGAGEYEVTLEILGGTEPLSCTTTVSILDSVPPAILALPGDVRIDCDEPLPPLPAVPWAHDACDPAPSLDLLEQVVAGPCPDSWSLRRTWTAEDASGNQWIERRTVSVEDLEPPLLLGVPGDAEVSCDAVPAPAAVGSTDDCDPAPSLDFEELREDGPCPDAFRLRRTWTSVDRCGNVASAVQLIDVADVVEPVLLGLPADTVVPCDAVPAPAAVSAEDDCDPAPAVAFEESREDGDCPDHYRLLRTWTATDRCGNAADSVQVVEVRDETAPSLLGTPADAVVRCDAVPAPALVSAEDACDPAPTVSFLESREDGTCPDRYRLIRTWTAEDRCGNVAASVQVLEVVDEQGPVLVGVPADLTVECDAVPPPAAVTAIDACDPAPIVELEELRVDGACPDDYTLRRTWTATDRCGNVASALQLVRVVDTQPPVVAASDEIVACLWPPNHRFACLDRELLSPVITDACSDELSWELTGCASSQADDARGDGSTEADCLIGEDGETACLRAERQGLDPDGRWYALSVRATDACGNLSEPAVVGRVFVPHDATELGSCPIVLRGGR